MISSNRAEKIINSYQFFTSDPVLKLLPDNKVEVSGICAWCNGNGSVDFHSCYACSGSGWLVFEDEEDEVREEQTEIEIKVE